MRSSSGRIEEPGHDCNFSRRMLFNRFVREIVVMPYGLIVLIAGAALVAHFTFFAEASWISKAVVSGLGIFSFASIFGWIPVRSLIGLFLLVALSIFIIFYRMVHDATSRK